MSLTAVNTKRKLPNPVGKYEEAAGVSVTVARTSLKVGYDPKWKGRMRRRKLRPREYQFSNWVLHALSSAHAKAEAKLAAEYQKLIDKKWSKGLTPSQVRRLHRVEILLDKLENSGGPLVDVPLMRDGERMLEQARVVLEGSVSPESRGR
jgi:hypothetical protein